MMKGKDHVRLHFLEDPAELHRALEQIQSSDSQMLAVASSQNEEASMIWIDGFVFEKKKV
jgi:hypothetical protein